HHRFGGIEDGARIQVEEKVPVLVAGLVHRRAHAESAREIAQHVDAAEALADLVHGRLHALSIEQIRLDEHPLTAWRPDVQQRQVLARECRGDCLSQVARRAGQHHGAHQKSFGSGGNFGSRFSRSEARPSFTSGPVKPWISSASEASNAGPAMRSQLLSEYLVQRSAVWGPATSLRATSSAFSFS